MRPYDRERMDAAISQFSANGLNAVEALIVTTELLQSSIAAFREDAGNFRAQLGDEATHAFARQELNDLIYELQDAIQPLIKTYNSLLRDPSQKHDGPPAD